MGLNAMKRNYERWCKEFAIPPQESNAEILAHRPIWKDEAHSGGAEKS